MTRSPWMPDTAPPIHNCLRWAAYATVASAGWQAITFLAIGYNLDFVLVGCAGVAFVFPFLIAPNGDLPDIAAAAGGAMIGALAVWIAVGAHVPQMMAVAVFLMAGLLAQGGAVRLLRIACADAQLAAAVTCVGTVAWLLWPLWLITAPPLLQRLHPLLIANGAVSADLSVWTEEPVPYQLTRLGQDVPASLPSGTLFGTAAYALLAATLLVLGSVAKRLRSDGVPRA